MMEEGKRRERRNRKRIETIQAHGITVYWTGELWDYDTTIFITGEDYGYRYAVKVERFPQWFEGFKLGLKVTSGD